MSALGDCVRKSKFAVFLGGFGNLEQQCFPSLGDAPRAACLPEQPRGLCPGVGESVRGRGLCPYPGIVSVAPPRGLCVGGVVATSY